MLGAYGTVADYVAYVDTYIPLLLLVCTVLEFTWSCGLDGIYTLSTNKISMLTLLDLPLTHMDTHRHTHRDSHIQYTHAHNTYIHTLLCISKHNTDKHTNIKWLMLT